MFKFIINPKISFIIFLCWTIIALIVLWYYNLFNNKSKFFDFGPLNDSKDNNFLGYEINTWSKVWIIYTIAFFSSFLQHYYGSVTYAFLTHNVYNHSSKKILTSKIWTYIITIGQPILKSIANILSIYLIMLKKFQFILPGILGYVLVKLITSYSFLKNKIFI